MTDSQPRLGEILVEAGILTAESLEQALTLQKERKLRLGTILLQEGFASEAQLVQALSRRLSIPWVSLWHVDIPDDLIRLVPANIAEEFFLIPVYVRLESDGERALYVAMNDPTDDSALRFVAASAGMIVKPMVAAPSDISSAIRFYYYGEEDEAEQADSVVHSVPPAPPTAPRASNPPMAPRASNPPTPPAAAAPPPAPEEEAVEIDEIEEVESEQLDEEAVQEAPEAKEESQATNADSSESPEEDELVTRQREIEKHMFGIGKKKARGGIALTLLDGTTIPFGGAVKKKRTEDFTQEDLIAGLKAAASGTPIADFLPSERWEDYMSALLQVLMKKHLVFFKEFMDELKKK